MPSHSCCGATWVQRKLDVGIKNGNLQHARIARDLGLPLTSAVCPPAIRGFCIACDAHGKSIKIEGLKVWIVPNDCIREKGTIIECQPTSLGEEWWHTHAICAWPHSDPANSLKVTRVTRNTKLTKPGLSCQPLCFGLALCNCSTWNSHEYSWFHGLHIRFFCHFLG